jgi:DNA polymerase-3 subunit alpha
MGIDVLKPDINHSEIDFTPVSRKILFGLSAIRNLGQGAIECILKAREEGWSVSIPGRFLRSRDLRTVNRRALEALIYCGAFDSLSSNRKQLIEYLDIVISWAQDRAKDRDSGQTTIFDLLGSTNGSKNSKSAALESAPKPPDIAGLFSPREAPFRKRITGFLCIRPSSKISSPSH